jgi:hypothetical protein
MSSPKDSSSSSSSSSSNDSIFQDGMAVSMTIFGATAYWFVKRVVRVYHQQQHQQNNYWNVDFYQRRRKSLQNLSRELSKTNLNFSLISERGQTTLLPSIPYLKKFLACLQVRAYPCIFHVLHCVCNFRSPFNQRQTSRWQPESHEGGSLYRRSSLVLCLTCLK